MKIHVIHSNSYDYKNELYFHLRNSELNKQHQIFLPHETNEFIITKNLIKETNVIIAEVSFSATGLGIELGWADAFDKPIICISKQGSKISGSLKAVCKVITEYSNPEELIIKLSQELTKIKL